jgi:type III secretion system low calcium response chaperone LcrH/SycD
MEPPKPLLRKKSIPLPTGPGSIMPGSVDQRVEAMLYARAYQRYNKGDYREALGDFQTLLKLDPTSARYYKAIAGCQQALGDMKLALLAYGTAWSFSTMDHALIFYMGQCLMTLGEQMEAASFFKDFIERSRELPALEGLRIKASSNLLLLESSGAV